MCWLVTESMCGAATGQCLRLLDCVDNAICLISARIRKNNNQDDDTTPET